MCSSNLSHQSAATMSLIQLTSPQISSREQEKEEFHHLRMAWALVADRKGTLKPRMHWLIE